MNKPISKLDNHQAAKNKLTHKQKIFVQHILDNPTDSYTEAAKKAYPNQTKLSQYQQAYENLKKPEIIMALGKANDIVESTLINTVQEWGNHEKPQQRSIAVDTAKYIHDKIHGKATQKVEQTSQTVSVNIDLSAS